jgi:myo-inositol-1-phosphate synthase
MFAMMALNQIKRTAFRCSGHPPRAQLSVRAAHTSVIRDIQRDLRSKNKSAVEITQQYLDAIARTDSQLNSFITLDGQAALQQVQMGVYTGRRTTIA